MEYIYQQSKNVDFRCVMEDKSGIWRHSLISKFLGSRSDNDALRHFKFINLPGKKTLYHLTTNIKQRVGFQQKS